MEEAVLVEQPREPLEEVLEEVHQEIRQESADNHLLVDL